MDMCVYGLCEPPFLPHTLDLESPIRLYLVLGKEERLSITVYCGNSADIPMSRSLIGAKLR